MVHEGFYKAYLSVKDLIAPLLSVIVGKYPNSSIYFTGHSLGGGLAVLAALDFDSLYHAKLAPVYTFGKPRIGNIKFASNFDQKLKAYRVVHKNDIFPTLPPKNKE